MIIIINHFFIEPRSSSSIKARKTGPALPILEETRGSMASEGTTSSFWFVFLVDCGNSTVQEVQVPVYS